MYGDASVSAGLRGQCGGWPSATAQICTLSPLTPPFADDRARCSLNVSVEQLNVSRERGAEARHDTPVCACKALARKRGNVLRLSSTLIVSSSQYLAVLVEFFASDLDWSSMFWLKV